MPQQLRPLPAFVVFMSGYWPLALVITVLDFDFGKLEFTACWTVAAVWVAFGSACWFTARHFVHYGKGDRVKITAKKDNRGLGIPRKSCPRK